MPRKHGLFPIAETTLAAVDVSHGNYGVPCSQCETPESNYRLMVGKLTPKFWCARCFTLLALDLLGEEIG